MPQAEKNHRPCKKIPILVTVKEAELINSIIHFARELTQQETQYGINIHQGNIIRVALTLSKTRDGVKYSSLETMGYIDNCRGLAKMEKIPKR